jgi:hypothetical protein
MPNFKDRVTEKQTYTDKRGVKVNFTDVSQAAQVRNYLIGLLYRNNQLYRNHIVYRAVSGAVFVDKAKKKHNFTDKGK